MNAEIITIGGLLVEIMRKGLDEPFTQSADLVGPFPSGDIGIFIDVVARMGGKAGVISAVGDDDFGVGLRQRLEKDGVDCSMLAVKKGATTGTAFVAYFHDGSRSFIYHWRDAAAGMLDADAIRPEDLQGIKWAHVTGVNISVNERSQKAIYRLLDCLPADAKVSFDPNIRPEVLSADQIRELCRPAMERADIFFPSKGEAMMFAQTATDDEGCKKFAKEGKLVVLKNGTEGCRIYSGEEVFDIPAYEVEEVDPTGAGDSFCAGFLTMLNEGRSIPEAGDFANAVGALAVTQKGPMEGAANREEVLAFMQAQKNR